jgi:hypothetical protein
MLTERGDAGAEKSPLIEAFMIEFGILSILKNTIFKAVQY